MFENIIEELKKLKEVQAITLGGSRATKRDTIDSDYDVYVYLKEELSKDKRDAILSKYTMYREVDNTFFELEDDCIMNDGIIIELIYRKLDDFDNMLNNLVNLKRPSAGYSTCFWHNILTSIVLYDPDNSYAKLKEKYDVPYPTELKENIISLNRKLLSGMIPSFDKQVLKAYKRNDLVAVNHRIAAFLASYFDIIFAYNEELHPGEKRLTEIIGELRYVPKNFKKNINDLLSLSNIEGTLMEIIANLDELIK